MTPEPIRISLLVNGMPLIVSTLLIVSMLMKATNSSEITQTESAASNLLRKSIVFDLKTPKVFYCPQEKFADSSDQMIVKARPLEKLCEFNGEPKPRNSPSDCYNDIDESEFACDEKRRFMFRLELADELEGMPGQDDVKLVGAGHTITKKRASPSGKKF